MESYVFLPMMEEEAGSRVTLLGGSAGMSEQVRQDTSSLYPPSPLLEQAIISLLAIPFLAVEQVRINFLAIPSLVRPCPQKCYCGEKNKRIQLNNIGGRKNMSSFAMSNFFLVDPFQMTDLSRIYFWVTKLNFGWVTKLASKGIRGNIKFRNSSLSILYFPYTIITRMIDVQWKCKWSF